MPLVIAGLIVIGAVSFIASILAVVAAVHSSRISRSEEQLELVEFTCSPESSPDLAPTAVSRRSDR